MFFCGAEAISCQLEQVNEAGKRVHRVSRRFVDSFLFDINFKRKKVEKSVISRADLNQRPPAEQVAIEKHEPKIVVNRVAQRLHRMSRPIVHLNGSLLGIS